MYTIRLNENIDEMHERCDEEFQTITDYYEKVVAQGGHDDQEIRCGPAPEDAMVVIPLALISCLHFLLERNTSDKLGLEDKAAVRGSLRWQLNEVN